MDPPGDGAIIVNQSLGIHAHAGGGLERLVTNWAELPPTLLGEYALLQVAV